LISNPTFNLYESSSANAPLQEFMKGVQATPNSLVVAVVKYDASNNMYGDTRTAFNNFAGCTEMNNFGWVNSYVFIGGVTTLGAAVTVKEKRSGESKQVVHVTVFDPKLVEPEKAPQWANAFSAGGWSAAVDGDRDVAIEFNIQSEHLTSSGGREEHDEDEKDEKDDGSVETTGTNRLRVGFVPASHLAVPHFEEKEGSHVVVEEEEPVKYETKMRIEGRMEGYYQRHSHLTPTPGKALITFQAAAEDNIHVCISSQLWGRVGNGYEIIIGADGGANTKLRWHDGDQLQSESTPNICAANRKAPFWIWLEGESLRVGTGLVPGDNVVLEYKQIDLKMRPYRVGFTSYSNPIDLTNIMVTDGSDLSLHAGREVAPLSKFGEAVDADEIAAKDDVDPATSFTTSSNTYTRWDNAWKSPTPGVVFATFQARTTSGFAVCASAVKDRPSPSGDEAWEFQLRRSDSSVRSVNLIFC
jgi:hypothetical protein